MKKTSFKRMIAMVLACVMVLMMLPTVAIAQSNEEDAVSTYDFSDLPSLPTTSDSYILLKNKSTGNVVLLEGEDDGYFGSTTDTIWNYDSSYTKTKFSSSYVSTFDGKEYGAWTENSVGDSFSLSGHEIVYKSKRMYPVSPRWSTGHIFVELPEGVRWEDKIIITYSNGRYRLYKPANNNGIWVDAENADCNFVYRDTLTSENQTLARYTYDVNTRTWTEGTFWRTEGYPYEHFYVGDDVFSTDGTLKRAGQHDFYASSSETPDDDVPPNYDLPSLPTTISDSYIILKNKITGKAILLEGEDDGYFGSTTDTIWNYDSSYTKTNFSSAYVSIFNGKEYEAWKENSVGDSFSLSNHEIVYKSKRMYPASPRWSTGHIFVELPEGVRWEDKIIITNSNGIYRLYKPANNNGIWVDAENADCNFVYRDTLTSENQTLARYTYDVNTRTWTEGTHWRTEGYPYEQFYVGDDVFSTDGTLKRAGQRDFYASSSETNDNHFEPLEPSEAKELLRFISNSSDWVNVEKKLPQYYNLLIGKIEDPEEEKKIKVSFLAYCYYCLNVQVAQSNERIDIGKTYFLDWLSENTQTSTIIFSEVQDELFDNLLETVAKNCDVSAISFAGVNIVAEVLEYGEILINAIGTFDAIRTVNEVQYLYAYEQLLKAKYEGNEANIMLAELMLDAIRVNSMGIAGFIDELERYAGYIFDIEKSLF